MKRLPGSWRGPGLGLLALLMAALPTAADDAEQLTVGDQPDGRIVVPTNQILKPVGKQVLFPGRPIDLVLADGGKTIIVKNMRELVFIDVATASVRQTLPLPITRDDPKAAFSVVGLVIDGPLVYASDAKAHIRVAEQRPNGEYVWRPSLSTLPAAVGGATHPAGLVRPDNDTLWATATRGNSVQRFDLRTGQAQQIVRVGVAPFAVVSPRPDRLYVSNWGGNLPKPGDERSLTSGTSVRVDPRTRVADDGTVSILGPVPGKWQEIKTLKVGLHPSGMAVSKTGRFIYVANANSDTVSVLDTGKEEVVATIPCRPAARLPFGSGSNALALSPDGGTLYVANGTNNCLAVINLARDLADGDPAKGPEASKLAGLIPTGWYPGAVAVSPDGKQLMVANVKGHGSLSQPRPPAKGHNSHDHLGSVSIIDVPDTVALGQYTEEVNRNNRLASSLAGLEKPRSDARPSVVPVRHGEASRIKHVVYVIKENRTYDQVLGDVKEGNGDARLCIFGEDITPNQHALARAFTLFDNFYCSGVLSADGHSWTDSAYVTDYLERAFGGFTRSYPDDGHDALAFAPTGFLWDNALAHHKSLRNYGEFVREVPYTPAGTTWTDLYNEHKAGSRKVKITIQVSMKSLEPYTHPTYPYFPLTAPDAYRADLFLEDLQAFERKGVMPDLMIMSLPCNHTEGTTPGFPTPRAMVADNDLALGRIVEAISRTRFWPETCIFVVEDDPQNGFDHVDGHRSPCLVISPYTRRGYVDHTQYNQTGIVKTIELMLGLPPMNQLDLSATPLRRCFADESDEKPYRARPNKVALDEMNPALKELKGSALHWAKKSLELDFGGADRADEDTLNRILWHAMRGDADSYPESFVSREDD